jgi:hypothetical protein
MAPSPGEHDRHPSEALAVAVKKGVLDFAAYEFAGTKV